MKRVGQAFKAMSKADKPYIKIELDLGVLGSIKAMMFVNEKKTSPEQPDYSIVIPDDEVKSSAPRPSAAPKPTGAPYKKPVIIPRPQPINHAPGAEPPNDLWDRSDAGPEFP